MQPTPLQPTRDASEPGVIRNSGRRRTIRPLPDFLPATTERPADTLEDQFRGSQNRPVRPGAPLVRDDGEGATLLPVGVRGDVRDLDAVEDSMARAILDELPAHGRGGA
jgi:hypothetical protein